MPMTAGNAVAGALMMVMTGLVAGCSPDSGWDLLTRTAFNSGAAWCRDADNCYPVCGPEERGTGEDRSNRTGETSGRSCAP